MFLYMFLYMFLSLNRPCRVHDAARRASVALARGGT
jgi:hypothetical protein